MNINGLNELNQFLVRLPRSQWTEMNRKLREFGEFVQRSAKARAPNWTGNLSKSIKVQAGKGRVKVEATAPYAYAQEFGFSPHPVSTKTRTGSGFNVGDWAEQHGVQSHNGIITVRNNKPFLNPALEAGLNRLPNMLSNGTKRALTKAGG